MNKRKQSPSDGCACIVHAAFYLFKHAEREAAFEALQDAGVAEPTPEEIKERVKVRNIYQVPDTWYLVLVYIGEAVTYLGMEGGGGGCWCCCDVFWCCRGCCLVCVPYACVLYAHLVCVFCVHMLYVRLTCESCMREAFLFVLFLTFAGPS